MMTTRARMLRAARLAAALPVVLGLAWAAPARSATPARPKPAAPPAVPRQEIPPVTLVPKARSMSTYTLLGRFEVHNKNVTFDTPPAYQESFAFWTGRMVGQKRLEVFELVTVTQEAGADGSVPFRRRLPRFNLEMEKKGVPFAPFGPVQTAATSLEWEGTLDRLGRVTAIKAVKESTEPEVKELAFEQMERLFPVLDGPVEIKVGGNFVETLSMQMPQRLNILGLEAIRLQVRRTYTLKQVERTNALFDVSVEYALDPKTPPQEARTTCVVSGGGRGEALFDLRRGVFLSTRLPTTLTLDIEAPLRRLPDQPEGHDPGTGKTRIELEVLATGNQTVKRLWGEEID
jgi:hypothetical protein